MDKEIYERLVNPAKHNGSNGNRAADEMFIKTAANSLKQKMQLHKLEVRVNQNGIDGIYNGNREREINKTKSTGKFGRYKSQTMFRESFRVELGLCG